MRRPLGFLGWIATGDAKRFVLNEAELEQLRRWHADRMERRLGPPDRRKAPRLPVEGRPLEGRAFSWLGRRRADRPDD
jgi:hypothetical protein